MEKRQNKSLAVLMLVLVIVLGAVVWGFLYASGWLVSLVAFATAYLGIVVYDKFYDVSKNIYVYSGIAIVLANIFASFMSMTIRVAMLAECDLITAFNALVSVMDSYIGDFMTDCIMCVIFTLLGFVGVKKTYEAKKIRKQEEENARMAETAVDNIDSENLNVAETEDKVAEIAKTEEIATDATELAVAETAELAETVSTDAVESKDNMTAEIATERSEIHETIDE